MARRWWIAAAALLSIVLFVLGPKKSSNAAALLPRPAVTAHLDASRDAIRTGDRRAARRLTAINAVLRRAAESKRDGDAERMLVSIEPKLRHVAGSADGEERRLVALQSALREEKPEARSEARAMLKDPELRGGVVSILGDAAPDEAARLALTSADPAVRREAILWLTPERGYTQLLRQLAMESDLETAISAVLVLSSSAAREDVIRALEEIQRGKPSAGDRIRLEALWALSHDLARVIRSYDEEKDERMKFEILVVLANSKNAAALAKVREVAASDSSSRMRFEAQELLAR